jgi:propanol-preferring alcohol dehydrogenase
MSAWRVRLPGPMSTGPLQRVTVPVPEPAPDELLVAVAACGVCRTDLHVTEGDLPVHRAGVVPGHEVVGEVVALGATAGSDFSVGDRVGIAWLRHTCGRCRYCVRGSENLCPQSLYTGWDADGGYAEFATVPASFAHRLPGGYTDAELAPLLCAGIIGYRSLLRAELPDGGRLGIYGFGGSAHITAQAALALGAEVHVMTRGERARELALTLGGIHLSDIPELNYQRHLFQERQVRSVSSNTRADAREFLDFVGRHRVEVTSPQYPMSRADEALADLAGGRIAGAAVLTV